MKYKIEYIQTFYSDIISAMEFLEDYPKKAERIFAKVDKLLWNLREMPDMYPVYTSVPDFRFIVVEDYLVFYKIKNNEGVVEVHRLLNGRMDISTHMQR